MTKQDLIVNNPLRALGLGEKAKDGNQGMGLVMLPHTTQYNKVQGSGTHLLSSLSIHITTRASR